MPPLLEVTLVVDEVVESNRKPRELLLRTPDDVAWPTRMYLGVKSGAAVMDMQVGDVYRLTFTKVETATTEDAATVAAAAPTVVQ
jgi:hypothetical protein